MAEQQGSTGLAAYAGQRLLLAVPVLFGVSLLVFGVLRLAPGDPAAIMLGAQATREDVERLRRDLGLDHPLPVQYVRWLGHVLRGDLGRSIPLGREVLPEVLLRFKATLILTGGALVIALIIGVPAGIVSATRRYGWLDKLSMGIAVTGVSLPVFWTGIMLIIVFALTLRWLPSPGMTSPYGASGVLDVLWHLILPAVTLGTASAASLARLTRSSVLEIIRQDYVRSARAKGLGERVIVGRHVLKNAVNPIMTVLGLQVGYLLGGAILTETVFSWPGLGSMMVRAIQARDYPLVQGGVLLIATTFVLVNLMVDLLYAVFDPRIRYDGRRAGVPAERGRCLRARPRGRDGRARGCGAVAGPARSRRHRHGAAARPHLHSRPCPRHRRVRPRPPQPPPLWRAHFAGGRPRRHCAGRGGRLAVRPPRRLRGALGRSAHHAIHRHPHGLSVFPARRGHHRHPRAGPRQRHGGSGRGEHSFLWPHRAGHRPRGEADGVRGERAGPRRVGVAPGSYSRAAQLPRAGDRGGHPEHRRHDHRSRRPLLPRPGRPTAHLRLGEHARGEPAVSQRRAARGGAARHGDLPHRAGLQPAGRRAARRARPASALRMTMSDTPDPETEALFEIVRQRYAARLTPEQLDELRKIVDGQVKAARAVRAVRLTNADEPFQRFEPLTLPSPEGGKGGGLA